MTKYEDAQVVAAVGSPLEPTVRPRAWYVERVAPGKRDNGMKLGPWWKREQAEEWADDRHELRTLYDQTTLDAALNLWPRDCRLCANFTTQAGGCVSVVQCVDSMQFKATTPRQYWIAGSNVGAKAPT